MRLRRRRRGSGLTRSWSATSNDSTSISHRLVRRDRLRRHPGAPPRPRSVAPPRAGLACGRRAAGHQHPQRPASQRRAIAAGGELDVRVGRTARPHAPAVLHPPRDREAALPRGLRGGGDEVRVRTGRGRGARGHRGCGPGGPALHWRALPAGRRRVLHLSVPGPCPARGGARLRPDLDRDPHAQPARIHPAVPGEHPAADR